MDLYFELGYLRVVKSLNSISINNYPSRMCLAYIRT